MPFVSCYAFLLRKKTGMVLSTIARLKCLYLFSMFEIVYHYTMFVNRKYVYPVLSVLSARHRYDPLNIFLSARQTQFHVIFVIG